MKSIVKKISVILVFAGLSSLAHAFPTGPVNWGGEPDMDACGAVGYTMADTVMITVRDNGSVSFGNVVPAGTLVTFCDYDESGYYGVLVHEEGLICGGGSATVPVEEPYPGPCRSGWIKEIFLELVAG